MSSTTIAPQDTPQDPTVDLVDADEMDAPDWDSGTVTFDPYL